MATKRATEKRVSPLYTSRGNKISKEGSSTPSKCVASSSAKKHKPKRDKKETSPIGCCQPAAVGSYPKQSIFIDGHYITNQSDSRLDKSPISQERAFTVPLHLPPSSPPQEVPPDEPYADGSTHQVTMRWKNLPSGEKPLQRPPGARTTVVEQQSTVAMAVSIDHTDHDKCSTSDAIAHIDLYQPTTPAPPQLLHEATPGPRKVEGGDLDTVFGPLDVVMGTISGPQSIPIGFKVFQDVVAAHASVNSIPQSRRVANIVWHYGGQFREKHGQLISRKRVLEMITQALRNCKPFSHRTETRVLNYSEGTIRQAAVHALKQAKKIHFERTNDLRSGEATFDIFLQRLCEEKRTGWTAHCATPNTGKLDVVRHTIRIDADRAMLYPGNIVLGALVDATRRLGKAKPKQSEQRMYEIVGAYGGIFIDESGMPLSSRVAIGELQRLLQTSEPTAYKAPWEVEIDPSLIYDVEVAATKAKIALCQLLYGYVPPLLDQMPKRDTDNDTRGFQIRIRRQQESAQTESKTLSESSRIHATSSQLQASRGDTGRLESVPDGHCQSPLVQPQPREDALVVDQSSASRTDSGFEESPYLQERKVNDHLRPSESQEELLVEENEHLEEVVRKLKDEWKKSKASDNLVFGPLDLLQRNDGGKLNTVGNIIFREIVAAHRFLYNNQRHLTSRRLMSLRVAEIVWCYGGQFREKYGQLVSRRRVLEKISDFLRRQKFQKPSRTSMEKYCESSIRQAATYALNRAKELYFLVTYGKRTGAEVFNPYLERISERKMSGWATKCAVPNMGTLDLVMYTVQMDADPSMSYPGSVVLSAVVNATRNSKHSAEHVYNIMEASGAILIEKNGMPLARQSALKRIREMLDKSVPQKTDDIPSQVEVAVSSLSHIGEAAQQAKIALCQLIYGFTPISLDKKLLIGALNTTCAFQSSEKNCRQTTAFKERRDTLNQDNLTTVPSSLAKSTVSCQTTLRMNFGPTLNRKPLSWSSIESGDELPQKRIESNGRPREEYSESATVPTESATELANSKENKARDCPATSLKNTHETSSLLIAHPESQGPVIEELILREEEKQNTLIPWTRLVTSKTSERRCEDKPKQSPKNHADWTPDLSSLKLRSNIMPISHSIFPHIRGAIPILDDFEDVSRRRKVKFPGSLWRKREVDNIDYYSPQGVDSQESEMHPQEVEEKQTIVPRPESVEGEMKSNICKKVCKASRKRSCQAVVDESRPALRKRLCSTDDPTVQTTFPCILPGAILTLDDFCQASTRRRVKFPVMHYF